jgi:hypothetical protein
MRWLYQNELQALLKEELMLKDVSMTFPCTLWQFHISLNLELSLTFHSVTCFLTVRSRHPSSQEVSK